jgi:hypothetical protein
LISYHPPSFSAEMADSLQYPEISGIIIVVRREI